MKGFHQQGGRRQEVSIKPELWPLQEQSMKQTWSWPYCLSFLLQQEEDGSWEERRWQRKRWLLSASSPGRERETLGWRGAATLHTVAKLLYRCRRGKYPTHHPWPHQQDEQKVLALQQRKMQLMRWRKILAVRNLRHACIDACLMPK